MLNLDDPLSTMMNIDTQQTNFNVMSLPTKTLSRCNSEGVGGGGNRRRAASYSVSSPVLGGGLFGDQPSRVAMGKIPASPSGSEKKKNSRLIGCLEPNKSEHWTSFHGRFKTKKKRTPRKEHGERKTRKKSCKSSSASSSSTGSGSSGSSSNATKPLSNLVRRIFFDCTGGCGNSWVRHGPDVAGTSGGILTRMFHGSSNNGGGGGDDGSPKWIDDKMKSANWQFCNDSSFAMDGDCCNLADE